MFRDIREILRLSSTLKLGLALSALIGLYWQSAAAAPNSERAVSLRSKAGNIGVRLVIAVDEQNSRASSDIELQRDDGRGFISIAHISKVKRRQIFHDSSVSVGSFSYRARLLKKNRASRWSKTTAVSLKSPAAPPQPNPANPPSQPPIGDLDCRDMPLPSGISECESDFETLIVSMVNNERVRTGLGTVAMHRQLNCAAREHTIRMIISGNFSHEGWFDSIQRSGYSGNSMGQNIALGFTTPASVMDGWMNSPGHKANILSERFRHLGVSCLMGHGYRWWTQDFGG